MSVTRRVIPPGGRIRVLVVDDSVVARRLVANALGADPVFEVVGSAANGAIALSRMSQLCPDVLTLDIEMPEMNGIELLGHIRRDFPHVRVIMVSSLTEGGAAITLDALTRGADDYVTKPRGLLSADASLAGLRHELEMKIRQFFQLPETAEARCGPMPVLPVVLSARHKHVRPRVVAIGVSTGGPNALHQILPQLPAGFPLPVLLVQHMPPVFTRSLAERLHSVCRLPVSEASHGDRVEPGRILLAPGNFHLKVASGPAGVQASLDQSAPLNSCRPAVDALFASVAEVYDGAVIAVILTGMGQDGLRGAALLSARGAGIVAQDEASSVVWGMPGAVVNAGLADSVLPLDRIVPEILRRAGLS